MEQIITAAESEQQLPAQERAIQITQRIKANGRIAVNAVCEIGKDLRTMRIDKLYTELGYSEFEEYAEAEFQLKRRQALQYISVYEKLGEDFVQANAQLGITKLAMLATANPEDRAEIMESEDLAHITTRELEQLLTEKKQLGEQLSLLQEEKDDAEKAYSSESDRVQELVNDQVDKNRRIAELERQIKELESAPKDVEVATEVKEVIKEVQVPDPETQKKLAEAEAALKEAKKQLSETEAEASLYKKSAESARLEAKKIKDNAEFEAEKTAKAEIDKFKKTTDERIRKAEKEKETLEAQIAELKAAAAKPPENADKSNFKVMLSTAYRDMLGIVEFIKNTENLEEREVYFKKSLEIVNACKESIMAIDIQPHIEVTDSDDYDYDDDDKEDEEE